MRERAGARLDAGILVRGSWIAGPVGAPRGEFEAMTLSELEHRHILATLQNYGWNKSKTAKILGIERSTLDRKIRRYGLVQKT